MTNLWILTEERPKQEVLKQILHKFCLDHKIASFIDTLRIIPLVKNNQFAFTYELKGFDSNKVNKVFIKIVSGKSSFVDFLIFYQDQEPTNHDKPLYLIEETKTDDKESRNTGVYQRCSKFVFAEYYYPQAKKIMLYNLKVKQNKKPTATYIFGTRLLLNMGVEIMGKDLDNEIFSPFSSLEELVAFKASMKKPPRGNIPINIYKSENKLQISGRLYKKTKNSEGLSHDPNIGALSIIAFVIRKLGWKAEIEIAEHGLQQKHLHNSNKFLQIASELEIKLFGLEIPNVKRNNDYWQYDLQGEKLATIFIHIVVENFSQGKLVFENHAGCERGYFITSKGEHIQLAKYKNKVLYKSGDKSQKIEIPDLILLDIPRNIVINIEGKKAEKLE
jgi:hypothetical protein